MMSKKVSRFISPFTDVSSRNINNGIKSIKDMPGPRPALPFIGTAHISWPFREFYGHDVITTRLEKMSEKYGPIYSEKVKGSWVVHLHDSNNIKSVLLKQGKFPWRPINEAMAGYRRSQQNCYAAPGTPDLNGAEWFEYKNKFGSLMSRRASPELIESLSTIAQQFMTVLESNKNPETNVIDILKPLCSYAAESTWFLVYGSRTSTSAKLPFDPAAAPTRLPIQLFASLKAIFDSSLWKYISTRAYRNMKAVEKAGYNVHREAFGLHSNNKENSFQDHCLLQLLKNDGQLTEKQMITLSMDSISSGTVLTGTIVSVLLHKLAQEPLVYLKLQTEVDDLLASPTDDITIDKLNRMTYIKACFKEGSRLASPIPYMLRALPQPITLDGYDIPAGTPIACHLAAPSKAEKNFRWADKFIPERWILPHSRHSGPQFADLYTQSKNNSMFVLPFGFGWRNCLGRTFAQTNIELLLAKLIRNFEMTSRGNLRLGNKFVIGPLENVNITLKKRTS